MTCSSRRLLSLALLVLLVPSAASAQTALQKQQAQDLRTQAEELASESKYAAAADKMTAALKLVPQNDAYLAHAARLEMMAGRIEDSVRHGREAVAINPRVPGHHSVLMNAAIYASDATQAKASAAKVVSFGESGNTPRALKEAKAILERGDLLRADLLFHDAVVLHREFRYGEALTRLKEALALAPADKSLLNYRAQLEPLAAREAIDRHALKAPAEAEKTSASLAKYLAEPARSEHDKARAIYRWLTDRVAYDTESYFSGKDRDTSPEAVLRSRQSVCAGYARLFEKLATEAGLSAVVVSGTAKGYSYQPGSNAPGRGHAWNAVRLDGTWHLLDATWGAGGLNGKVFAKKFSEYYYLTPPEQFVFSHFPEVSKWQLLTPAITSDEFRKWPLVDHDLFEVGVSIKELRSRILDDPTFEFAKVWSRPGPKMTLLDAPLQRRLRPGLRVVIRVEAPGMQEVSYINGEQWTPLTKKGHVFEGSIVPRKGTLSVSGRLVRSDDRFWGILKYDVE